MINPELKDSLDTTYDLLEVCEDRFEKAPSYQGAKFLIDISARLKEFNEEAAAEHQKLADEAKTAGDRGHHFTHYLGYTEMALYFDSAISYFTFLAASIELEETEAVAKEVEEAAAATASKSEEEPKEESESEDEEKEPSEKAEPKEEPAEEDKEDKE